MDISGFVVLGIVTLFLVYLMPQLIRSRQDVIDARVDDRFSCELRILATAGAGGATPRPVIADGAPRAYLHRPSPRTEVSAMNRPLAQIARSDATAGPAGTVPVVGSGPEVAARAAARAALARRKAAARRRLVLTLMLLALAIGSWSAVGLGVAPVALALVPSLLLAVVLVLGRRAAKAGTLRAGTGVGAGSAPRPAAPAARAPRGVGAGTSGGGSGAGRSGAARPAAPRGGLPGSGASPAAAGDLTIEDRPVARTHRPSREMSTEVMPRVGGLTWRGEPSAPAAAEMADGAAAITTPRPARPAGADPVGATDPVSATAQPRATAPAAATDSAASPAQPHATAPDPTMASPAPSGDARNPEAANSTTPAASDDSWTPVPVPAPTYTMKPQAPRMETAPLVLDQPGSTAAVDAGDGAGAEPGAVVGSSGAGTAAPGAAGPGAAAQDAASAARSLDLNAVLARRRAAGE